MMQIKKSRRAQLQNAETMIVIIIVTIMMVIGLVFVMKFKARNVEKQDDALDEERAMEIFLSASGLNELRCSKYAVKINTCYDHQRIMALSYVLENNLQGSYDYYYNILGNSKITVQIITGDLPEDERNITLYNYNNSGNKSSSPVMMPIMIMDGITGSTYFGVLEVRTYS
jgi:hypothetical protein